MTGLLAPFFVLAALVCGAFPLSARAGEHDPLADLGRAVAAGEVPAALEAMEALIPSRPAGTAEAISEAFESDNAWIRRGAVRSLAILGEGGVDIFLRAMEDQDALVRLDACRLAPRFADGADARREVRDALISRIYDDERRGVRAAAAEALGIVRDEGSAFALEAALKDREPGVRCAALAGLGRVAGDGAFAALASALESDGDQRARAAAAGALGELAIGKAAGPLARALKDVSGLVRAAAAEALGRVGTPEAVEALDGALALFDEDLHVAAAHALGFIGTEPARKVLRRTLFHPSNAARRGAAESLGYLGDAASLELLARLTEDFDPGIRTAAVVALGGLADPRAGPVVRRCFEDRIPEVRARAAEAAGRLADTASIPAIVGLTRPVFSEGERVAAAAAIGVLGDAGAVDLLAGLLDDSSEPTRRAAAAAMGRLGIGGDRLLAREASFAGDARVEFLGALATTRTPAAKAFFKADIRRHAEGSAGRFACEVGLFLLGEDELRESVVAGAVGRRDGANATLAIIALVLAGAPEAERAATAAIRARAAGLRESAALALGVARPAWAGPLLREAAKDLDLGVALRARVGLRWLESARR
jgi:HEAT repeat protein